MNYQIIHDTGKPMCFIGDTWHNQTQYQYWVSRRQCEIVTLEHATAQSQSWWDHRQFMCAVTNVAFKKRVVNETLLFSPDWFSIIHHSNEISNGVIVGKNTLVNCFNTIYGGNTIGNHVTLTNYVQMSHRAIVEDMCHVGPYAYLCFTTLRQGVCVGLRSSFPGKPHASIVVSEWNNIAMDSRVTRSIEQTGTWFGNRRLDTLSSLDKKLL